MVGKQDKCFTMEEFYDAFGWECERCAYFDGENEVCNKGRRIREYTFIDGPNEKCHAVKFCMLFTQWNDENSMSESIEDCLNFALSSSAQMYC